MQCGNGCVPQRTKFLWTEVTGSAPADGISISVKCHRPTRPVTTGASDRRPSPIAGIGYVAGLRSVSRAVRIGYGTAHDSAGHHTSSDTDQYPDRNCNSDGFPDANALMFANGRSLGQPCAISF